MIKNILTFIMVIAALGITQAQEFSGLDKSPADIAYYRTERGVPPVAKVVYSRPQLKGRSMADLAPAGEVWRTGANETTEIKFYQTVMLGDQEIAPGTYSLFTIPGADKWTVILNSETDMWGAYTYDQSKDVARVEVEASQGDKSIEAFSITFGAADQGATMYLGWGNTRVSIPIALP